MEVFEALKKNLTETAQFAAEKAKLAKDILVASDQIRNKKKEMRRLTYKIGQTYLDMHSEDCDEEFRDFVRGYYEAKDEMELKQAEVDSLKEQMKEFGFGDIIDTGDNDAEMEEFFDDDNAEEAAEAESVAEEATEEAAEAESVAEEATEEAAKAESVEEEAAEEAAEAEPVEEVTETESEAE